MQARLQELQKIIAEMDDAIGYIDSAKIARWENLTAMVKTGLDLSSALKAELVALSADPAILKYQGLKKTKEAAVTERDGILGGSAFTPWPIALDKDGKPLKGSSYHMQTAYGEDEIWVCGKNVYQGLVISACDAAWKFLRLPILPPALPIGNNAAERLAGGSAIIPGLAFGATLSLADIQLCLASDIMIRDDNNIFSYGSPEKNQRWRLPQDISPGTQVCRCWVFSDDPEKNPWLPSGNDLHNCPEFPLRAYRYLEPV